MGAEEGGGVSSIDMWNSLRDGCRGAGVVDTGWALEELLSA